MDARNHCAHCSCVELMLICTFVMVMNKMVNTRDFDVTSTVAVAAGGGDSDGPDHKSVVEVDFAAAAVVAGAVNGVFVVAARQHILAYGCSSPSNRNVFRVVCSHRCAYCVEQWSSSVAVDRTTKLYCRWVASSQVKAHARTRAALVAVPADTARNQCYHLDDNYHFVQCHRAMMDRGPLWLLTFEWYAFV